MTSHTPTRIAFCITDLDPGGAERALVQLVTRLDRNEWEPAVYCLAGSGDLVAVLEDAGVPVTCFNARGVRDLSVLKKLTRELRAFRPQLLQTFLFHANLIGRLAGWRAGVPLIVSGIRVAEKRMRGHLLLDRVTNRLVNVNVCVSRAVADFSIERGGLSREKTIVIPNGVDYERFANAEPTDLNQFSIPADSFVFVSVGRLDPQKGLTCLLDATAQLKSAGRENTHLLLVGDGPQREELIAHAKELGIDNFVHFAGWRADVAEILRACHCLVLSSLWEGMANVVLEGMAAGIPVVATAVEGTAEQITDGVEGLLVAPNSVAALASAMETIIDETQFAQRLAKSAQAKVNKDFTWDAVTAAYEQLYRELLAR